MSKRLLLLSLILCTKLAVADGNPLEQARALIDNGEAHAAYAILKPLETEQAGEAEFDYLFGLSALDSDHPVEAVFALERVVDSHPDNGPARAELARAYLALGETDDAKSEFKRVSEMDLPPDARQTIDRYMSNIELFHDRTRTRFRPWVLVGVGYVVFAAGATSMLLSPFVMRLFGMTVMGLAEPLYGLAAVFGALAARGKARTLVVAGFMFILSCGSLLSGPIAAAEGLSTVVTVGGALLLLVTGIVLAALSSRIRTFFEAA